jgi:hypothetical protein
LILATLKHINIWRGSGTDFHRASNTSAQEILVPSSPEVASQKRKEDLVLSRPKMQECSTDACIDAMEAELSTRRNVEVVFSLPAARHAEPTKAQQ